MRNPQEGGPRPESKNAWMIHLQDNRQPTPSSSTAKTLNGCYAPADPYISSQFRLGSLMLLGKPRVDPVSEKSQEILVIHMS